MPRYPNTPEGDLARKAARQETRRKARAKWVANHPEKAAEVALKANKKHRQKTETKARRLAQQQRYMATPEGQASRKAWLNSSSGRASENASRKKRYHENPDFRMRHLLRTRLNSALSNVSDGSGVKLLGCTIAQFKLHIESLWQPGMSWDNYAWEWHLDHIIALGLFDLTDPAQLQQAAHYTNLQPLFTADHQRKTTADIALIRARKNP